MTRAQKDCLLKKIEEYYAREIKEFSTIDSYCNRYECSKDEYRKATIQRGLGIAFFAQELGVPYNEVNFLYCNFKNMIENM